MNLDALTGQVTAATVSPAVFLLALVLLIVFLLLVVITRGRILRIFRILFRRSKFIRTTRRAGARARSYVGSSGFAAFGRMFHPLTETEKALVKADAMTPATEEAMAAAIAKYKGEGGRNPDIDAIIHFFEQEEARRWKAVKHELLSDERRNFFRAHKEAIKKQRNAIIPPQDAEGGDVSPDRLSFDDVDFEKLDYDKIGEYIDEAHILSEKCFTRQSEQMRRRGLLFKDLSIRSGYIRLEDQFDLEHAEKNYLMASKFYLHDIPVQSDEDLLYEDISDSLIVNMMGSADKDIFYYLTEMRKIVNRNVRLLSMLIAAFVALFIAANYWAPSGMELLQILPASEPQAAASNGFFDLVRARLTDEAFQTEVLYRSVFAAGAFLFMLALVGFYYRNPYTHYQSQNRVHLINFMTTYSALLVSNYTNAESHSRGSFSGDQSGIDARENAKIWFMNMQWIAFRLFCVEVFLRSVLFQIKRNSGYYVLGMPLLVIVPTIILLCWLTDYAINGPFTLPDDFALATIEIVEWLALNAAFFVLLLILWWNVCWKGCLTKCVQGFLNIEDTSWKNFHNLDLQRTSAGLVRHFVAEIYNERNRWRSGASGGNS